MMVWSVLTSSQSRPILIAVWQVVNVKMDKYGDGGGVDGEDDDGGVDDEDDDGGVDGEVVCQTWILSPVTIKVTISAWKK